MDPVLIIPILIIVVALIIVLRTVRIVPQQTAQIVERLGSYNKTLTAGIHFLVPFVDKVRANIDLREQVVTFPPQPVITSDNLVVSIDTVIYYSVIDAKAAVYEIANFITGIEFAFRLGPPAIDAHLPAAHEFVDQAAWSAFQLAEQEIVQPLAGAIVRHPYRAGAWTGGWLSDRHLIC